MYTDFKIKNKPKSKPDNMFIKLLGSELIKTLFVILIFVASLIYISLSSKNKETFNKIVYQNSLSFAKIYDVYNKYLGDVIPFKNTSTDNTKLVSSEKLTYDSIEKKDNGYVLKVSSNYSVPSVTTGIVIEASKDYIKVQDKNGLNIKYGYISDVSVSLYDYVKKGEMLGNCDKQLYLEFNKDDEYLSYDKYL